MKHLKKMMALALAMVMVLAMSITVFADTNTDPETPGGGDTPTATVSTPGITIKPNITSGITENGDSDVTITYTYYKILTADIGEDPTGAPNQTGGKVAYYVTSSTQAVAIAGLKTSDNKTIFNVTEVEGANKWYVELNTDTNATGEQIATAFNDATFLANFTEETYANTNGGDAVLPNITAGYYFIKSSLGSKMAVQTLTEVEINEKNEYVTDDKTIPTTDQNSQIGQEITYTLTVNVPATATEQIVLTDTMSKGLTFKEIKSQKIGTTDATAAQQGTVSAVSAAENDATKFTITYTADQVKALVADGTAKVINVEVTVIVNEEAAIDTGIPNTLDLKYGNNYDAVPKSVETKTTKVDFDKVDGSTKLTGAEFKLTKNTANTKDSTSDWIKLVEVTAGETYRIATAAEITTAGSTLVDKIVTTGKTVTINGLDLDDTYFLVETKAPTGYNILDSHVELTKEDSAFVHQDIQNNKGSVLPSTGGIGTTIFYIIGAVLVLGAGVLLVTRRRMNAN